MIIEYLDHFKDLISWIFISVIITPILAIVAAPSHLIYIVALLFIIDVCVGIQTDHEGFSIAKFRQIFPKFVDASLMIIVMSLLANLHPYTAPLQLTGYILVALWLASSIIENKINDDLDPENPWRKIRNVVSQYASFWNKPKSGAGT